MELIINHSSKTENSHQSAVKDKKSVAGAFAGQAETKTKSDMQISSRNMKRICVLRCGIVWLHNFTEDLNEPGKQLILVREPDNPVDRWAVQVHKADGTILGYLPAAKNQSVARLMDAGKNITVFVDEELHSSPIPRYRRNYEKAELPLALYMDVIVSEENE